MPTNVIACRPQSYGKFPEAAYAHLASIGVRHVEIPIPRDVDAELKTLRGFGLAVSSVQGGCHPESDAGVAEFAGQLDPVVRLGARIVFVSAKTNGTDRTACHTRLRAMGDAAAAKRVTIALETHPDFVTNAGVALETMRAVNHPAVRLNWDTANIYYYNEGVDGLAELRQVLPFVAAVHLKDTNGKFKTWHFPALGDGIVDFMEVFRLMAGRGFSGPYTIELEGIEGEDLDRARSEARVARSVEHLRKLGVF